MRFDLEVAVNGSEENSIFTFLKSRLPSPSDSKVAVRVDWSDCWLLNWLIDWLFYWMIDWLIDCWFVDFFCWFQGNLLGNPKFINWSPVKRWDQAFSFLAYFKTLLQVGYILEFWKVPNPSWWHSCSQILQVCCCFFCFFLWPCCWVWTDLDSKKKALMLIKLMMI